MTAPFHLSRGGRIRTPNAGGGAAYLVESTCSPPGWPFTLTLPGFDHSVALGEAYYVAGDGDSGGLDFQVTVDGLSYANGHVTAAQIALASEPVSVVFTGLGRFISAGDHDVSLEVSDDAGSTWNPTSGRVILWSLTGSYVEPCF